MSNQRTGDPVIPAQIRELASRVTTWGRFGQDDEKGMLNCITPEHRVRAAGLVRRGAVFSLAIPIRDGEGPMCHAGVGRPPPTHQMTLTGSEPGPVELGATADYTDDLITVGTHTTTHWDALSHFYYDGQIYNGFPASEVGQGGAPRGSIDTVRAEFVARGVLLDVARLRGVTALEPGHAVGPDELSECERAQHVEIGAGDILLVRTGAMTRARGEDWSGFYAEARPGVHHTSVQWLVDRGVAALAVDNSGVEPPSDVAGALYPLHMLALRDAGIHLGEFWYLEELAAACADDGCWEFLLVAQPLRIVGGVGSPVNPLAIR